MSDDFRNIIEAVIRLQDALKSAGLERGALEVKLGRDDRKKLSVVIKASPSYLHAIRDPRIGVGDIKIANVQFVE